MGRELIDTYVTFRNALLTADEHFKRLDAPWSLIGTCDLCVFPSHADIL